MATQGAKSRNRVLFGKAFVLVFFLPLAVASCQSVPQKTMAASAAGSTRDNAATQKGNREDLQMLTQRILNKDRTAILLARQSGSAASPELLPLLKNPDPEVREVALYCLDEAGGPDALKGMLNSLLDDDAQVRAAALQGLNHHPDPSIYDGLLAAYDRSQEPYARQQILLLLGRVASSNGVSDLKRRCAAEQDADAQEGCVVSLARLNDSDAQKEFVRRLQSPDRRARYLEYCEYIHAPWLMKPLLPILDDKSPMVRVAVDARPDLIQSLRACDIAVNLIASISGRKFSFEISRSINYSDVQIAEVKASVQKQP